MASPFPGMDPFLESSSRWPLFHHELVTCLYQGLLSGLGDRYRARIGQRIYATQQALLTSIVREEHREEFVEIRQRGETRINTLIEVVSPDNKTSAEGRQAYISKRYEAKIAGANLVEIDLSLQGMPIIDYPRHSLGAHDYVVAVTRMTQPNRPEIWASALSKRLPQFKVPLARNDKDLMVDLQNALARCYDKSNIASRIDYASDAVPFATDEKQQWIDRYLRDQKLR